MPRKTRASKRRVTETIRPSVQTWLETGSMRAMEADNGWLRIAVPHEARDAYLAGDLETVRRLLAAAPAGHNYFVRG